MQTRWTDRYAQRTQSMRSSLVRELLKLTARPGLISFAGGLPAAELFPLEHFRKACDRVLSDPGALQYSTTEGERPLREVVAAPHRPLRHRRDRGDEHVLDAS